MEQESKSTWMITFHVPDDRALLAAFGEVSIRHEHLTYILRMTIKTLAELRVEEALDATVYEGSRQLRERIRRLARQRLGEGQALLKLQAIIERCGRATDRRNDFMHSVWAKELDGEPLLRGADHTWRPLPSIEELLTLAAEMKGLVEELNKARLEGFLSEALLKRAKLASNGPDNA